MNSHSDEQLMNSLIAGHRDSLGVLYERYDSMARAVVSRFAPEISEAERDELVQDIFIAVDDSAHRFPRGVAFRAWFYGIVANKTRKWRRNTWVRHRLLKEREGHRVGMAFEMNNCPEKQTALRQVLSSAIQVLPVDQRDVFVLHAADGFSGDEIAGILKISPKTVRTRLYRARKKLLEKMDKDSMISHWEGSSNDL